ncbi:MAG: hypothetical protein M1827_005284 [Pycnora praestabilis]|nr:MAG: hypothetical protein M1827_005284 [Pycnora praestabilis]
MASYFDRPQSSAVRPGLSHIQSATPGSPQTPQRNISSAFGSPSASYRAEDDYLVFEFGSRFMRAGFSGESTPRCALRFGPEEQRRVGDYRGWEVGHQRQRRRIKRGEKWGEVHELWHMDLRDMDLRLVEDKIERAVREAYTKYFLLDSKPKKLLLALPSVLPHPLLFTLLTTLFTSLQSPSITLMSSPLLTTVAAGLRSALVIDIGWSETVVTAIYEYRELHISTSVRGTKVATLEMGVLLNNEIEKRQQAQKGAKKKNDSSTHPEAVSFEESEEVLIRVGWCRGFWEAMRWQIERTAPRTRDSSRKSPADRGRALSLDDDPDESLRSLASTELNSIVSIPLQSSRPQITLQIPFHRIADPIESALFTGGTRVNDLDDEELPVHLLAYSVLQGLPADVRGVCMSRIIITGGGSKIPGIKQRILDEMDAIIEERGWDKVRGKAVEIRKGRSKEASRSRQSSGQPIEVQHPKDESAEDNTEQPTPPSAASAPQEHDPIEDKLRRDGLKGSKPFHRGQIRGVASLGPWAGGSLVAGLKMKGVVEIEKDTFLQQGLAGASKRILVSLASQKPNMSMVGLRSGVGDRSSWTLGAWG